MNYSFLHYEPLFPELFEKEKSYLQKILGRNIVVEHFGSTAVFGLGGKGVIDIYLLAPKDKMKSVSKTLQLQGYVFKAYAGNKNRWFHQINKKQGNKEYHYHIHLSFTGNKNFKERIAFRDYLRIHPEAAEKYSKIKQIALNKIKSLTDKKEIRRIYLKTKGSVIKEIMQKAKKAPTFLRGK